MDTSLRAWYGLQEVMRTGYSSYGAVSQRAHLHREHSITGLEQELIFFYEELKQRYMP